MFVKKSMEDLDRLTVEESKQANKHPIIVILDDVRSMHNVGATFRTADAFAVRSIFLCGFTPQPPHRDIHKTALGATETVHWQYFSSTVDAVQHAIDQGFTVVAVEQTTNSISLTDLNWTWDKPIALVFGNEVNGVVDNVLKMVTQVIEIPQWGSKHSLNISVSVGVVLWEIARLKQ